MSATRIFSTLSGLLDVSVSGVTSGQFLQWNGSAWVATTVDLSGYVPTTRTVNGQALSGNVTITTITGNAGSATVLATPRNINGVAFDGSANIGQDLQTSASPTFTALTITGAGTFGRGTVNDPAVRVGPQAEKMGLYSTSAYNIALTWNGIAKVQVDAAGVVCLDGTLALTTAKDVVFVREAAGASAQRNGTNAQSFRVYNTYTSSTNYERGAIRWASNVMRVGTGKGSGGGTARDLVLETDETTRLTIDSLGRIIPVLPTSSAGLPTGALWNDGGTVKVA